MKNFTNRFVRAMMLLLIGLTLSAGLMAQNRPGNSRESGPGQAGNRELLGMLENLRFDEDEMSEIVEIQSTFAEARAVPTAELEIIRAQIQRELISNNPDLDTIEDLIRSGIEFEVTLRMAEINRELSMQELIGVRRWTGMKQAGRMFQGRPGSFQSFSDQLGSSRPDLQRTMRVLQIYMD